MTQVDPSLSARIGALLRDVPDFPQPGILFKDIAPLLADADGFAATVTALGPTEPVDLVAGIEARGFVLAGALAHELGCGLVPVRKAGKLPPPTVRRSYDLEYGSAEIEVPVGVLEGKRVLVVDDVLATGGTLRASVELLAEAGATVVELAVILEIAALGGRAALADLPPLRALVTA
ncbi:adenine phosphoribosyltransferase [Jatrophihabitans endophyticus]|uniref:Adenine phosphoribosyltransferase n=1 Tax=Jatrophihabitans endophyticus TaxID=1206085 RepID=A0A1M5LJI4_9ACTN|nr:adenine phosphoribosyltransferase [Jatrophihabitans endophyticus]SHG65211.1 adenine phosphoribosyltransferase [Jatrophihabitans endophyticus]